MARTKVKAAPAPAPKPPRTTGRRTGRVAKFASPVDAPLTAAESLNPTQAQVSRRPELGRLATPQNVYATVGRILQSVSPERIRWALADLDSGRYELISDLLTQAKRDPIVKRAYDIRRTGVAGRKYTVSAPQDIKPGMRNAAEELAELFALWLESIPSLETFLMRVLEGVGMGISGHELVWGRNKNLWLPTPASILTREIQYANDWSIEVRNRDYQWINTSEHPGRFMFHIPQTDQNRPNDGGCLLSILWYWLFKINGWGSWLIGAERFGTPLMLAKLGTSSDPDQRQNAINAMLSLMEQTVGAMSMQDELQVIDAKAAGSTPVWKDLTNAADTQIFIGIGVSPDLLLVGPNGGRASTETRSAIKTENSELDAQLMWGSIVEVARWLGYYNLHASDIPLPIVTSLFDTSLPVTRDAIEAGAVTNNEIRAALGLPAWTRAQGGEAIARILAPPVLGGTMPITTAHPPGMAPEITTSPTPAPGSPAAAPFPSLTALPGRPAKAGPTRVTTQTLPPLTQPTRLGYLPPRKSASRVS